MSKILTASLLTVALVLSPRFAAANESIETQPMQQGQLVYPVDMNMWSETSRNEAGLAITSLIGTQNLLPAVNPLALSLSNSAMTFSLGGNGQVIIAQDTTSGGSGNTRIMDSCPSQTITIPSNSTGSTRVDLLSIQYNQLATNSHVVPFSNNTTAAVSNALESCLYNYTTNTTSPPSNYVAFAKVSVPNGATTASQATVTYLFPTVASQLNTALGGLVNSIGGLTGAVSLSVGNGLLQTIAGNTITTTLATPVSIANGGNGTGVPTLTAGTNLSSSGSWGSQTLNVVNNPTFSGLVTTSAGITSPSNSNSFGQTGKVTLADDGSNGYFESPGAIFLLANDGGPSQYISLATNGTTSFPGEITTPGSIVAGNGTAPLANVQTGDLAASRSSTTGEMHIGGSSSSGDFDYGVSNSGVFTMSKPLYSNASIVAGDGTAPLATVLSGDLAASRSSTGGKILLGGTSSFGTLDYGLSASGVFSMSAPLINNNGGTYPLVYVGGSQKTSKPIIVAGLSGSISPTSTGTYSFGVTLLSAPTCTASWLANTASNYGPSIQTESTTSVTIYNPNASITEQANVVCVGQ
jgi:hypothetical protein